MIPVLYESNETKFTSNGIGRLSDALSCEVTEERNGQYELEMLYPITGIHYSDISLGRFIYATPSRHTEKQAFEIYEVSKPISGKVTIYARHISYRLSMLPCMPFTKTNISDALQGLKDNAAESCPFTFSTNKTTTGNFTLKKPSSIRSILGGTEGSILDVYGTGEYEWDMYNVKLWQSRGQDRGVQIRYGKNLTDLKQEESIADTITGIVPYFTSDKVTVTLPEKTVETDSTNKFPYPRTITVDLSQEFNNTVPTVAQLRAAAATYIKSHSIGVPKVSLSVSFANLSDTEEYKDIAVLEEIKLCDTVEVIFEKLGVKAKAKVIKTIYDVLRDKYKKIELGESKTTLSSQIAAQEMVINELPSFLQSGIDRATNLITGESGGYVIMHTNEEGKPYEILIMDTDDIDTATNVWRWNKSGWGYSKTGYNGTYTLAATIDGGIVADFIKAGTITGIAFNNGNGKFKVDASGNLTATSATITGTISSVYSSTQYARLQNGNLYLGTPSAIYFGNLKAFSYAGDGDYITLNTKSYINGPMISRQIELIGNAGIDNAYIDFHWDGQYDLSDDKKYDWSARIIEVSSGELVAYNAISNASDKRLKENIIDIDDKYEGLIELLDAKEFSFKKNPDKRHLGFIAQDLEEALKEIGIDDIPILTIPSEGYIALNYDELIPILWNAIKKLMRKLNDLERRVDESI